MKKTIGILVTGAVNKKLVDRFGEYDVLFHALLGEDDFDFKSYWVMHKEFPKNVTDCDGWLVTGSAFGAYEDHGFIPPLEDFIREAHAARVPMIGICFGHQIMAQALGGKVVKFDGGWGIGNHLYDMDIDGKKVRKSVLAVHQDQVVETPPSARIIASSDFCSHAGLAYGDNTGDWAVSFQPHPEFSKEWVKSLLISRHGDAFDDETVERGMAALDGPLDSPEIGAYLREFLAGRGNNAPQ